MSRKYFVRFLTVSTSTATPSKGLKLQNKTNNMERMWQKKKKGSQNYVNVNCSRYRLMRA